MYFEDYEGSDTLIISFGAFWAFEEIPEYEFYNVLTKNNLPVKKLFLRDIRQHWYLKGIQEIETDNISSTAQALKEKIKKINPKKLILVGGSSGGFAAILFGSLLKADDVIAFSPQINFTTDDFIQDLTHVIPPHIDAATLKAMFKDYEEYKDLTPFVQNTPDTRYEIFIGGLATDERQIESLKYLSNVHIFNYYRQDHNSAKHLRDEGYLRLILLHKLI